IEILEASTARGGAGTVDRIRHRTHQRDARDRDQTVERSVLLGHAVPVEVVHAATARSAYARPVGAVERVVALTREQRVLSLEFAADVEVVAVFGEAADAPRGIDSVLVAAAMLGGAERAAQMDALNFFLSDDVDDARDRVCTVGRR